MFRVMACAALVTPTAWLAKLRLLGERLAMGAELPPVPERLTVWGLPATLSLKLRVPVRVPLAPGVKDTLIGQLTPGATWVRNY